MQKTDNRGCEKVKVCLFIIGSVCHTAQNCQQYRYHEMSRCVRQWRYLKDLKRGGASHTSKGVDGLDEGALAIECPACPHPERNLPPDWENAPKEKAYVLLSFPYARSSITIHCRWLYSLFIAMDANFKLKQKSRDIKDPEFGSGLAYFVNIEKFKEHLKHNVCENEVRVF